MRKYFNYMWYKVIIISFFFGIINCHAKNKEHLQFFYKKIANDLIDLRKQFPATQAKVYALLDQLDKSHTLAKSLHTKKSIYKKKVSALSSDNAELLKKIHLLQNQLKNNQKKQLLPPQQNSMDKTISFSIPTQLIASNPIQSSKIKKISQV